MSDSDLYKKLDELAKTPGIIRKVSLKKTKECPNWNSFDGMWEETDAHLRERLKAETALENAAIASAMNMGPAETLIIGVPKNAVKKDGNLSKYGYKYLKKLFKGKVDV
jgi:hypothetical protein